MWNVLAQGKPSLFFLGQANRAVRQIPEERASKNKFRIRTKRLMILEQNYLGCEAPRWVSFCGSLFEVSLFFCGAAWLSKNLPWLSNTEQINSPPQKIGMRPQCYPKSPPMTSFCRITGEFARHSVPTPVLRCIPWKWNCFSSKSP